MVLIDRDLEVERFDYRRHEDGWASVRLLAAIDGPPRRDAEPRLLVEAQERYIAPVGENSVELRLGRASRGGGLLWVASFAVPAELVEAPSALFGLASCDGGVLALPAPRMSSGFPGPLVLSPRARRGVRLPLPQGRQLAAAATLAAFVGTSAPAVSLGAVVASAHHGQRKGLHTAAGVVELKAVSGVASVPVCQVGSVSFHPRIGSGGGAQGTCAPAAATPAPAQKSTSAPTTTPSHQTKPGHRSLAARIHKLSAPVRHLGKRHEHSADSGVSSHTGAGASTSGADTPTHTGGTPAHTGGTHTGATAGGTGAGAFPGGGSTRHSGHGRSLTPHPNLGAGGSEHHPTTPASPPLTVSTGSTPVPVLSPTPPYENPRSWTGTVTNDPALTGAVQDLAGLVADGNRPPSFLIPIYMQAGKRYGIPWEVLAAINAVETDYGRDLSTSSAGAVGWMQFMPSTWKEWGVAVDGHSVANPYDPRDAIFSAARYLAAAGARRSITQAVFAYNHASWYVQEVMSRAEAIAHHAQFLRAEVNRHGTFTASFETGLRKHPTVTFSGGVLSHYDRLIAAANMVSAANFPYLYGGGHEQPARFGPFDCSGSVSYVMQQAGYKVPTTVSGDIPIWKFPAGPGRVTIFYNPVHTFMRIGDRYFGTSGFARPGGGAGWFDTGALPASYLATFREVHVPHLGPDSFAPTLRFVWPKLTLTTFELDAMIPRDGFFRDQR